MNKRDSEFSDKLYSYACTKVGHVGEDTMIRHAADGHSVIAYTFEFEDSPEGYRFAYKRWRDLLDKVIECALLQRDPHYSIDEQPSYKEPILYWRHRPEIEDSKTRLGYKIIWTRFRIGIYNSRGNQWATK